MEWNKNVLTIEEVYTESKTGSREKNEDAVYYNADFIAVIDGATSKTEAELDGETGGRLCARQIVNTIRNLKGDITAPEAARQIWLDLKEMENKYRLEEKGIHSCASAVIFSCFRKEIWLVGDCRYMINGKEYSGIKQIDRILSEARAAAVHMLLGKGITEEQLMEHDLSREMILPLLREQKYLENGPEPYGYPVFNCYTEPGDIIIRKVPDKSSIVLASDGYPVLKGTLAESERELSEILKNDPLCYKVYCSTKGLKKGNVSFDDRSYIRFSLK